jgi:DNA-binding GntR family transcriptional regulator
MTGGKTMDELAQLSKPARGLGANLSAQAYRALSDMIRQRRLKGGQSILEAPLAEALGISRTPLREALQRLEGERMVWKSDGRNYVVRKVDIGEYLQSLRLRLLIEPEAAALAMPMVPRAKLHDVRREVQDLILSSASHTDYHWDTDDRLHGLIMDFCGNAVMAKVLSDLRVTTRLFEIDRLKDRLKPDSTEHLEILDAIAAEDAARTRRAVAAHVESLIAFARGNL